MQKNLKISSSHAVAAFPVRLNDPSSLSSSKRLIVDLKHQSDGLISSHVKFPTNQIPSNKRLI